MTDDAEFIRRMSESFLRGLEQERSEMSATMQKLGDEIARELTAALNGGRPIKP